MTIQFIHLNVKSEYTLLNSIAKSDDIIKKVQGFDIPAVAITDMNTMHNTYHFEQHAKKAGVRNIIGATFCVKYEDTYGNLVLLAKDTKGYKNLVCLSTIANKGEKKFAFIEFEKLQKYSEGLICLTGGTSGLPLKLFQENDSWANVETLLKELIDIYSVDNLYFEFQNHGTTIEKSYLLNKEIESSLKSLNLEVVATNDVYYLEPEHSFHRALALEMNPNPDGVPFYSSWVDSSDQWYLKTPEEMLDLFSPYLSTYPRILSNTVTIADRCQASVPVEKALPEFPIPEGFTEESYFRKLCEEGFHERFDGRDDIDLDVYRERFEYEFDVIKKMGFMDYHTITADFIQWAKDDKVYEHPERYFPKEYFPDYSKIPEKLWKKDYPILMGPGRGSAAGCLLCYCLKITDLDPIKDGLLFERFLNVERVSMPDIDIDVPNQHRQTLIEYVQAKYGYEKVCQIATFQTLGVKSLIKSLGKAIGLTYNETDDMTKHVPDTEIVKVPNDEGIIVDTEVKVELLSQLEKYDFFKEKMQNPTVKHLFEVGKVLEGLPSATGKHAAGVIIARKDLMNYVPLMEVDGVLVSQFEKKAVESIGLLKMDFLGLQTLDILAEAVSLVKKYENIDIDINKIPRDDAETFETIFKKGATGKIFQFESAGMKKLLVRMQPTCLADLCLANAAYRPGPLQFIDEFIEGRNHPERVKYPTKEYEAIAEETKGILFYQEQVMQIVQAMAGFTLGEADILRRGIGKKEKKYIDEGRERFVKGCLKLGTCDEKTAKYIYSTIEKFANYGFNKSHSDAYGLVAYYCGYLKCHYPECFMAANCTINSHNVDKLSSCLSEVQHMGIPILLPDIRKSSHRFILEKTKDGSFGIRFSLAAIRSCREEAAEQFENVSDKSSLDTILQSLNGVTKRQIAFMIQAGAMDYLGARKSLVDALNEGVEKARFVSDMKSNGFGSILSLIPTQTSTVEYSTLEKLQLEKAAIQISLSGHPVKSVRSLTGIKYSIPDLLEEEQDGFTPLEILGVIDNLRIFQTKKGDNMASFVIEDEFSSLEAVVFPRDYKAIEDLLSSIQEMTPYVIIGKISYRDGMPQLVVSDIKKIQKSNYTLYVTASDATRQILEKMSENYNGIASVVAVNPQTMSVETYPFQVDICDEFMTELRARNITFIVKK